MGQQTHSIESLFPPPEVEKNRLGAKTSRFTVISGRKTSFSPKKGGNKPSFPGSHRPQNEKNEKDALQRSGPSH